MGTDVAKLPDPFLMNNGKRVASVDQWLQRREEIKETILHYQYGFMPPAPDNLVSIEVSTTPVLEGAAVREEVLLTFGPNDSLKLRVFITTPLGNKGALPVIIRGDLGWGALRYLSLVIDRGYVLVEFDRTELRPDKPYSTTGAQDAYPSFDWAAISVWAWAFHRVVDYVYKRDDVNKNRITVTGHSRGGKAALLAGALDERIALTVPNGSGCGGAGSYSVRGEKAERIVDITARTRYFYWFAPGLRDFSNSEEQMPFDQHFLMALVAPRALLSTNALGDLWANPKGSQQMYLAAREVYQFLSVRDRIGLHFREGEHAQNIQDWLALLDFADQVFFGKQVGKSFDKLSFSDQLQFSWAAPTID